MNKIAQFLQWAWSNREEIMSVATAGTNFASLAGVLVTSLLNKTPDGNPDSVTDEMIDDLRANWRGVLPSSESLGFPEDEEDPGAPPDEE